MKIGQNTDLYHDITVKRDGELLLAAEVEKLEFTFGDLTKVYPENSDVTAKADGVYSVRLTQEETRGFSDPVPVQVRYKLLDGAVDSSQTQYIPLREALSKGDL